jgi:histidine triad (HIT) family protein
MSVIGLEVPHVHVHLIPLNHMEDIRFVQKTEMSAQEFEGLAQTIASHFEG